jgi:hypothetical protein
MVYHSGEKTDNQGDRYFQGEEVQRVREKHRPPECGDGDVGTIFLNFLLACNSCIGGGYIVTFTYMLAIYLS